MCAGATKTPRSARWSPPWRKCRSAGCPLSTATRSWWGSSRWATSRPRSMTLGSPPPRSNACRSLRAPTADLASVVYDTPARVSEDIELSVGVVEVHRDGAGGAAGRTADFRLFEFDAPRNVDAHA